MVVSESAPMAPVTERTLTDLSDFWINATVPLPGADEQGIRIFKQRRYIELADGHFVQIARDPASGDWRAALPREIAPSGPVLVRDERSRYWQPKDNSRVRKGTGADDAEVESLAFESTSTPLISQSSIERRVRALYPDLPDGEVTSFIAERLQVDPLNILRRLEHESVTLREELEQWLAHASVTRDDQAGMSSELLVAQQQSREKFSRDLQAVWRGESIPGRDLADNSFSTFIDFSGALPHLSARFERVTELVLSGRNVDATLGRFLEGFPNVRYLIIEALRMEDFSPAIFQMRDLLHLTLNGCSLRLTRNSAEGLSRIETLTLLDLRDNPLHIAPSVGFMRGLRELMLRNCSLTELPDGLERLPALTRADLRGNDIVVVGDELSEIPDTQNLYLDLTDNPLGETARQRITRYLESASLDRRVQIHMEEADADESSESSDSSDSGMESDV
ncbi:leucine-rich repeat domain-containing protein [Pseudomonas sp. KCJK9016]|uniref:leucine-rich repeat domain-containing protein n=1 Tax=Pseudomonas sp. KCJK9016 TaxID=3344556 RepID=UPI003905C957